MKPVFLFFETVLSLGFGAVRVLGFDVYPPADLSTFLRKIQACGPGEL